MYMYMSCLLSLYIYINVIACVSVWSNSMNTWSNWNKWNNWTTYEWQMKRMNMCTHASAHACHFLYGYIFFALVLSPFPHLCMHIFMYVHLSSALCVYRYIYVHVYGLLALPIYINVVACVSVWSNSMNTWSNWNKWNNWMTYEWQMKRMNMCTHASAYACQSLYSYIFCALVLSLFPHLCLHIFMYLRLSSSLCVYRYIYIYTCICLACSPYIYKCNRLCIRIHLRTNILS
jgi:hypothetical protein